MAERKDNEPQDGALLVADPSPRSQSGRDDDDDRDRDRDTGRKSTDGSAGDGKADEAAELLDEMFELMELDADVDIREDGERIVLDVSGEDAGRVIGKKGQTLDALQFLLNKILNRDPDGRRHIIVDSGDYRDRHDANLETLALREAERAVEEGKVVTLQPMSARDRRVIHLSLAKFDGVTTSSHGQGSGRRIQIIPSRRRR